MNETEELRRSINHIIKAVKWIGVFITVTGIIIVLLSSVVLASMNNYSNHHPVDYEVKVNDHPVDYEVKVNDVNETACSYLKQFDLKDHLILSVCNRDGEIIFDIRLFINQTATIRGIPLNLRQWNALQRVSPSVNGAIEETTDLEVVNSNSQKK